MIRNSERDAHGRTIRESVYKMLSFKKNKRFKPFINWNKMSKDHHKQKKKHKPINIKRCLTLPVIKVTILSALLTGTSPFLVLKVPYSGIPLCPGQTRIVDY